MKQRESSFLFDFVDPHNIRLQQNLMLWWFLLCDYCSCLYHPKTSQVVRPSMPTSHRHFLPASLPHFIVCSSFKIVICRYQPPRSVL
jgi:hypothetical protein